MNLWVDEVDPCGTAAGRHPVLYLYAGERGGALRRFAEQIVRRSVDHIVERPAAGQLNAFRAGPNEALLNSWQEVESQFTSSSLGVIAKGGDEIDAILQLLNGEAGETSEVANVVMFMLTRPRGMTIRDVVMMPTNFDL